MLIRLLRSSLRTPCICVLQPLPLQLPPVSYSTSAHTTETVSSSNSIYSLRGIDHKIEGDQLLTYAKSLVQEYSALEREMQKDFFIRLAANYGANKAGLDHAIQLYQKNPLYYAVEVRQQATPLYYKLLRTIGNLPGGVKTVCDMRAHILEFIWHETDREKIHSLRRIEEACRELLTVWFCLSNLRLERVTWESPGDILYKIAENEAVHPIRGIGDFRKRIGAHRRCFYFGHEAMPREPLVMVHVALMDRIADNVQNIVKSEEDTFDENLHTTAIYYSITSIQKGLSGIDLGNMLIKQVATQITSELPNIKTHCTLSPIPGFRAWLLRCLHGHSEYGQIVDDFIIRAVRRATGQQHLTREGVAELLIKLFSAEKIMMDQLDLLREPLMYACAQYLYLAKRNKYALNPVANFHLRNGAEMYRINWRGDTSSRGLENSLGIMANYRYRIENVPQNSQKYASEKVINVSDSILKILGPKLTDLTK